MAEALKRKLKTRRGHQLVTTNLLTKTRGLLPPLGNVADGELKLKLEGCKRSLEKKKTEIQTLNDEILEAIEDEKEIEDEIFGRAQNLTKRSRRCYAVLTRSYRQETKLQHQEMSSKRGKICK